LDFVKLRNGGNAMYLNCYAKSSSTVKIEMFQSMQFIVIFRQQEQLKKKSFRVRTSLRAKNFVGNLNETEFKTRWNAKTNSWNLFGSFPFYL